MILLSKTLVLSLVVALLHVLSEPWRRLHAVAIAEYDFNGCRRGVVDQIGLDSAFFEHRVEPGVRTHAQVDRAHGPQALEPMVGV